jgi:hypothetical protein
MKIYDDTFHFKGFGNCKSRCRLRIYQIQSDPQSKFKHSLHMGDKVVILTQLEGDNVGTSVTNASEIIANAVATQFKLEPLRTVWIEHYPERGHPDNMVSSFKESFDRVTYDYIVSEISRTSHKSANAATDRIVVAQCYFSARWNHITRDIVADLIGEQP